MKKRGKAISYILTIALVLTTVCMPMTVLAAQSDPLNPARVTITNNAGEAKDIIYITSGTKVGDIIRVYNGTKMVFQSGTAKGASFRFEIPAGILDDKTDGTIDMKVIGTGKEESDAVSVNYKAAPKSLPAISGNILVTNNVQGQGSTVYDRVNITGLRSGDIFYVYYDDPASGATPIAYSTTATTKGLAEAILRTDLPDTGSIWITVKSTGRTESEAVEVRIGEIASVTVGAVDTTRTPIFATATNNYGSNDRIMITGLYPGDEVQAMEESTDVVYGSGKVAQRKTDIEITAKSNRTGLLAEGGSIIIKVTTTGKTTVTAGPFKYDGELKTSPVAIAAQPEYNGNVTSSGSVTIYNYENKLDQIEIRDLSPGDKILITTNPTEPQTEIELKTGTVGAKSDTYKGSIKLPAIDHPATTGSIRIYVTSTGKQRSDYVVLKYAISLQSETPVVDITSSPGVSSAGVVIRAVTNSAVKFGDSILVTGVERGDQVMIYENQAPPPDGKAETTLNSKSSGTVAGTRTEITVLAEFPEKGAGTVYVSYMKPGLQESGRVAVNYDPEKQSVVSGISFTAINVAGVKDTLTITGAPKDALIQVYTTSGANYVNSVIKGGYIKIKTDKPVTTSFAFPEIPTNAPTGSGVLYIGVTLPGETESDLIEVNYDPEPLQDRDLSVLTAQAINVFGPLDYVIFSQPLDSNPNNSADMIGVDTMPKPGNLYPGHTLATAKTVITLYASTDPAIKTKMGSLTLNSQYPLKQADGGGYILERIVSSKSLNPQGGTIAYTLTYPGKAESDRYPLSYSEESQTDISLLNIGSDVQVTNNINTGAMPDYVDVSISGIVAVGSTIKIYNGADAKASVIANATVTARMTSDSAIRILLSGKYMLGPTAGSIWMTVQEVGKAESDFVEVPYLGEAANQTPDISALSILNAGIYAIGINNGGTTAKDFIFICGLEPEDTVVLTYKATADAAKDTIRAVKVAAEQSTATINIYIPEAAWSNGFITVTRKGMSESNKIYLSAIMVDGAPK